MMRTAMRRWVLAGAMLGMMAGASGRSEAAITTFFGQDLVGGSAALARPNATAARNSFLGNLVGVSTETFESFAGGAVLPLSLAFGPDVATLGGVGRINSAPETGAFATSGTKYLRTSDSNGALSVAFDTPQAAFGFFATDIGDIGSQVSLSLTLSGGSTQTFTVPSPTNVPNGAVLFFGVVGTTPGDTFTRVTFTSRSIAATDVFGFDDLTIGRLSQVSPVPEPSSLALCGLSSLAGLGAWARRRKAVTA